MTPIQAAAEEIAQRFVVIADPVAAAKAAEEIISRHVGPAIEQAEKRADALIGEEGRNYCTMIESERDSALRRAEAAEKEHAESQAAQRSIINELQTAMADVFRHLGPPTDRHAPWSEQVMDEIDSLRTSLTSSEQARERAEKVIAEIAAVSCVQTDYARAEECQRIAQKFISTHPKDDGHE